MCQTVYSCFFGLLPLMPLGSFTHQIFCNILLCSYLFPYLESICVYLDQERLCFYATSHSLATLNISFFFRQKDRCRKKFAIVMGRGLSPQKWVMNSAKHSRLGGSGAPIKDLLPSLAPFPSPSSFYGPVQSPDDDDTARVPSSRRRRRRRLTTKDEEEARFSRTFVPLVSELRDGIWREELLLLLTFLSPSPPLRSVVVDVVISRLRIRPPCTHGQRRGRVCPPRPLRK